MNLNSTNARSSDSWSYWAHCQTSQPRRLMKLLPALSDITTAQTHEVIAHHNWQNCQSIEFNTKPPLVENLPTWIINHNIRHLITRRHDFLYIITYNNVRKQLVVTLMLLPSQGFDIRRSVSTLRLLLCQYTDLFTHHNSNWRTPYHNDLLVHEEISQVQYQYLSSSSRSYGEHQYLTRAIR